MLLLVTQLALVFSDLFITSNIATAARFAATCASLQQSLFAQLQRRHGSSNGCFSRGPTKNVTDAHELPELAERSALSDSKMQLPWTS
ncbi:MULTISPECIES: hypothetical protein [unclassified Anaerobiospirillum]|uniref:hypothetical protein n=1 Tax=unclassified Anaerobiospirillum TaxID=2647410 RepID=UPI001FF54A79|nr:MULTISPECIES: hypothetical protein [unclassified Anaerobiospirillum]MCK0526056.1 hypothetical protein [Anaerobiospirillum sp. NML120449]MCK0535586.1 hypothetical protein [Anaerobiospirillum sp. NML120511]